MIPKLTGVRTFSGPVVAIVTIAVTLAAVAAIVAIAITVASADRSGGDAAAQVTSEVPAIRIHVPGEAPPDSELVWDAVNARLREEIGATVDMSHIGWADYPDRIRLMLASGNEYELHFDADWFMWPELVADGALMPLNDLLPRHAPALYEHYRDVGALEDVTVDGRILGLPATEFGTGRAWAVVNAEWYEAFGANEPLSSMEQVVELMEYVDRHVESIDYPLDQIWGSNPVNENAMWAMYTKHDLDRAFAEGNHGFTYDLRQAYETGEVEIVAVQETEAYREAAQWRRTFHERGWIPRDAMHDEGETYRFHHGNSAITIRGLRDQFMATSEGVRIEGFMMYPDSYAAFSGFMRNGLAMNRNAANPELALAFLEWMYESQANYDLVMYGIEGTTYELARENGQEVVRHTVGRGPADGYPHWHGRWGFWRLDRIRAGVADGDPELYSEAIPTAREHPTNVTSPLAGFQFDPSQVRSEIALRKSLLEEHEPPITHGLEADVDRAIEHLREILNEAGAEVIRTELQRQVDEFLASR